MVSGEQSYQMTELLDSFDFPEGYILTGSDNRKQKVTSERDIKDTSHIKGYLISFNFPEGYTLTGSSRGKWISTCGTWDRIDNLDTGNTNYLEEWHCVILIKDPISQVRKIKTRVV